MKKNGIWHAELARLITALGHTDHLVVCDAGLPIPRGAEMVDLAVSRNLPRFSDVVDVILTEGAFEAATIAGEMACRNPEVHSILTGLLGLIPTSTVTHEEFKRLTRNGDRTVFVRTGEATPYANVLLVAGVAFE
jgi:D-ribose pyranase